MSKKMDIYTELDNFVEENGGQVTLTDVAKHFADYGYKNATDKVCELLEKNMFEKYEFDEYGIIETYACSDSCDYVSQFVEQIRKSMED